MKELAETELKNVTGEALKVFTSSPERPVAGGFTGSDDEAEGPDGGGDDGDGER